MELLSDFYLYWADSSASVGGIRVPGGQCHQDAPSHDSRALAICKVNLVEPPRRLCGFLSPQRRMPRPRPCSTPIRLGVTVTPPL